MKSSKDYADLPLKFFYVTLDSDEGPVRFKVPARTKEFAIQRVLKAENAPESAVIETEEGDELVEE